MKKQITLLLHSFRDLAVRILPDRSKKDDYRYAFIVHPRSHKDVARKYPIFKFLPKFFVTSFTRFFWPVILSEVTGLKSVKTGKELKGYVITIPLTARQMLENRPLALKRIIQAATLAKKNGAKLIGLGALTSSLSKGGLDLVGKVDINITTGHAYTAYNVTNNLFKLADCFEIDRKKVWVGIVGAAGSVGSTSAKLIARAGFNNILLVDVEKRKHFFAELAVEMKQRNPAVVIETSHQIGNIKKCDFIITATNAPEALIKSADLKGGAVVIDDAQPSDISQEVFKRDDVLAIEAGVTHTPGVFSHFNFGLKHKLDNFCCMGEVLILASHEWNEHYVINRASVEMVDKVAEMGKHLNFTIAEYQNFHEIISPQKLSNMKEIIRTNHNVS